MESYSTPEKLPIRSVLKEINANGVVNKSPSNAKHTPLGLESEISDIDTTLSPGHDTTADISYTANSANLTCSDLINGFGGLGLNTPHGKAQKSNNTHIDANVSSDDDALFQECEDDLDETTTVADKISKIRTEVSNISNGSFNFAANVANSTANVSQADDKSSMSLTPIVCDTTNESIFNNAGHSTSNRFDEISRSIDVTKSSQDPNKTIDGSAIDNTYMADTQNSINTNSTLQVPNIVPKILINSPNGGTLNRTSSSNDENSALNATQDMPNDKTVGEIAAADTKDLQETVELNATVDAVLDTNADVTSKDSLNATIEHTVNSVETPQNVLEKTMEMTPESTVSVEPNLNATTELPVADSIKTNENSPIPVESIMNQTIEVPKESQASIMNQTIEVPKGSQAKAVESTLNQTIEVPQNPKSDAVESTLNQTIEVPKESQTDAVESETTAEIIEQTSEINTTINVSETTGGNTTLEPPTMGIQPVMNMPTSETMANATFNEPMDVDMNETPNFPPPPPEILSAAHEQTIAGEESLFNQTIDMKDIEEAPKVNNLNVTIDSTKSTTTTTTKIQSPFQGSSRPKINNVLDQTQVLGNDSKSTTDLNRTVELDQPKAKVFDQTMDLTKEPEVNQTFITGIESPINIMNQTRNLDQNFKPAPRRPIHSNVQQSKPPNLNETSIVQSSKPTNLNETVVVENNLPSVNTTFIATDPVKSTNNNIFETPKTSTMDKIDETFKVPQMPNANPFGASNIQTQNAFGVSDDEFQSPGLILNPTDFDFLLSKGTPNSCQNNPRDSILERFDPILGRKSIIYQPPTKPTIETTSKLLPTTILETSIAESTFSDFNEQSAAPTQLTDTNLNLNTTETKLDQNNSGEGDFSQASSTTETYETASIGDQLKTDVNMSVGLIHDNINMDNNIKSIEQEQPNLKMNEEQKVNKDMIEDVERKLKEAEAREEALLRRITEKEKALNKMSAVVENYEKTMVEMLSEREKITQNYEKQLAQAIAERDSNFHHLTSLESTFSDLHVKYEKSKQMALEVRENEAKLKEKLEFCQQQMKLQEQRYDKLKNHALAQLESANNKLENLSKTHASEKNKLMAQIKKEEITRQSIMDQLAQKTKENEELVKICDELINNGGS